MNTEDRRWSNYIEFVIQFRKHWQRLKKSETTTNQFIDKSLLPVRLRIKGFFEWV